MNINSVKNQYLKNNTNINKSNNIKAPLENAALNYKTDISEIKSINFSIKTCLFTLYI